LEDEFVLIDVSGLIFRSFYGMGGLTGVVSPRAPRHLLDRLPLPCPLSPVTLHCLSLYLARAVASAPRLRPAPPPCKEA